MAIALLLAGGRGLRFKSTRPKQFSKFFNRSLLEYSLSIFEMEESIESVLLVVHPEFFSVAEEIVNLGKFQKIGQIVKGGSSRQQSVWNGLQKIDSDYQGSILIHDSARPFLSAQLVEKIVLTLKNSEVVVPVLSCRDALIRNEANKLEYQPRECFLLVQTPQGFRFQLILFAHRQAISSGELDAPDDLSLILKYSAVKPELIDGEWLNVKVTYPADLDLLAELMLRLK